MARSTFPSWGSVRVALLFTAIWWVAPAAGELRAQVTSPGALSRAHEDWSGSCSQCHAPGSRTASDQRCLSCHEPLAARIAAREGYHADRSTDCASCHREHQGQEARLVQFEPAGFSHATIGYPLQGEHVDLECSGCHNTIGVRDRDVRLFKGRYGALSRTYLGLDQDCTSCHVSRDPHGSQFEGRPCASCHDETVWAPAARFDHANARYPLTGRHVTLTCSGCHRSSAGDGSAVQPAGAVSSAIAYRPTEFGQCTSCHRDEHAGELGAACASCHSTAGWARIPRRRFEGDFDHGATAFPLEGRHAATECTSCHRERPAGDPAISLTFSGRGLRSYPTPVADGCTSCHLDYHDDAFEPTAFTAACEGCHTSDGWAPSQFDLFMHDRSRFELTGAHRVVPCSDCHARASESPEPIEPPSTPDFTIHLGSISCATCHETDDPHAGQFPGVGCATCHVTESFNEVAFDHSMARFSLEGAHEDVACASCHIPEPSDEGQPVIRFTPLSMECRSCHG